jgi:glycosyltransferase involved in cell wall biosynthesis
LLREQLDAICAPFGEIIMKTISIVTPCYNEEANVELLKERVRTVMAKLPGYSYEHIFIDNFSKDATVAILKAIAKKDHHVKIIVNSRNFGHIRSPFHGILQARGAAVVLVAADLQDPPELISEFVERWERGFKVVIGVKRQSRENRAMFITRKLYYSIVNRIAETEQIKNFTGFGLYDRVVVDTMKLMNDPYPYFRGLITEIGFERAEIPYVQPRRTRGKTKNNFYTLWDLAMLGFVNSSKVPLRLASFVGFSGALVSLVVAAAYLVYKLVKWNSFNPGVAPLVIGLFFFGAVQMFFIGMIGEYVGAIYTQVRNRPHVVEKERVNFD